MTSQKVLYVDDTVMGVGHRQTDAIRKNVRVTKRLRLGKCHPRGRPVRFVKIQLTYKWRARKTSLLQPYSRCRIPITRDPEINYESTEVD